MLVTIRTNLGVAECRASVEDASLASVKGQRAVPTANAVHWSSGLGASLQRLGRS
jgi:hypothetical protein